MSRELILNKIRENRPKERVEMPQNISFEASFSDKIEKFTEVLRGIGGTVLEFDSFDGVIEELKVEKFPTVIAFPVEGEPVVYDGSILFYQQVRLSRSL